MPCAMTHESWLYDYQVMSRVAGSRTTYLHTCARIRLGAPPPGARAARSAVALPLSPTKGGHCTYLGRCAAAANWQRARPGRRPKDPGGRPARAKTTQLHVFERAHACSAPAGSVAHMNTPEADQSRSATGSHPMIDTGAPHPTPPHPRTRTRRMPPAAQPAPLLAYLRRYNRKWPHPEECSRRREPAALGHGCTLPPRRAAPCRAGAPHTNALLACRHAVWQGGANRGSDKLRDWRIGHTRPPGLAPPGPYGRGR